MVLQRHVTKLNTYLQFTTRSMNIKLSKVMSYNKWLLHMKSDKPLKTWSQEVMLQIKYISTTTRPLAIKCGKVLT